MRFKCRTCGFRSSSEAFFRRERGGLFGRHQVVCDGCAPYRSSRDDRAIARGFFAIYGVVLFVALNARAYGAGSSVILLMMMLSGIATIPLRTLVHELGHAAAVRMAGFDVVRVVVGRGPTLRTWRFGDMAIEFRAWMFGTGFTSYLRAYPPSRWRRGLILAAGPLADALTAAASVAICLLARFETLPWSLVPAFFASVALTQAIDAAYNLFPIKDEDGDPLSDGARLLALFGKQKPISPDLFALRRTYMLVEMERFDEAAEEALSAAPSSGVRMRLFAWALHAVSCGSGERAAVDCYLQQGRQIEAGGPGELEKGPQAIGWLKANVAWFMLLAGDPAHAATADAFSADALEALPNDPAVRGTRGAWLVQKGRAGEAVELLVPAVRNMGDWRDKARFSAYLACALQALGEHARADGFDQLGQHLLRDGRLRDRYDG